MDQLTAQSGPRAVAAHVTDGCLHAAMILALVPMIAGQTAAALATGMLLVAMAMALSPFVRRSTRVGTHVLDLLAMGLVTVAMCVTPSTGAVGAAHAVMAMPMAATSGAAAALFVAAIWVALRIVQVMRDRAHRRWFAVTGILTAGCLAVMFMA